MNISQPLTVKTSISPAETQIGMTSAREEKVKRYICLTFSSSLRYQSLSEDSNDGTTDKERMKVRRAVWQRGHEEKRLSETGSLNTEPPWRLFICCCLHRELSCRETPLTRFFPLSEGGSSENCSYTLSGQHSHSPSVVLLWCPWAGRFRVFFSLLQCSVCRRSGLIFDSSQWIKQNPYLQTVNN